MRNQFDQKSRPAFRGPWYRAHDGYYYGTIKGQPTRLVHGIAYVEAARARLHELTKNL